MHATAVAFTSKHNLAIAARLGLRNYSYLPPVVDTARFENTQRTTEHSAHEQEIDHLLSSVPDASCGIFVGQMKARKGWDILLRAIPHVSKDVLEKFIIVTASGATS